MLSNFTFTLYEIFGYLLPGSIVLVGLLILAWALFVPVVPLGLAGFQPGVLWWTGLVVTSYVLGHAVQAVGNRMLSRIEKSAMAMNGATWMRERAKLAAAELLGLPAEEMEPRWVYRVLDEYALQEGHCGDRDTFTYREGFYRGSASALFFLALSLIVRLAVPGASVRFTSWLFPLSSWQLLAAAVVSALASWLFLKRYKRFAEYRVTRAVLAGLVLHRKRKEAPQNGSTPAQRL